MSEQDYKQDVQRAEHARQVIENYLVKEALKHMRDNVYKAIESSKASHTEAREEAYYMLRAITAFEGEFRRVIEQGKKSANRLKEAQKSLNKLVRS